MTSNADTYSAQSPQLQPLTFGMILDRTINLYIHNFVLLFGIMLIPQGLNYANEIVFTKSLEWSIRAATALYFPASGILECAVAHRRCSDSGREIGRFLQPDHPRHHSGRLFRRKISGHRQGIE
jgi:hypothetical protein